LKVVRFRRGIGIFLPVAVLAFFATSSPTYALPNEVELTAEQPFVDVPVYFSQETNLRVELNTNVSCDVWVQGGYLDPFISVFNSLGQIVAQDDDGNFNSDSNCLASLINVSVPAGEYVVRLRGCCSGLYGTGYVVWGSDVVSETTTTTTTLPFSPYGLEYWTFQSSGSSPSEPLDKSTAITSGVVDAISYDWGSGQILDSGLSDGVIVWFEGFIQPPDPGIYDFYLCSDDGMRLYLNGLLVLDEWFDRGSSCGQPYSADFADGEAKTLKVSWYENGGGASAHLRYMSNGLVDVPTSWYSYGEQPETTTTTSVPETTTSVPETTTSVPETTTSVPETTTTIPETTTTIPETTTTVPETTTTIPETTTTIPETTTTTVPETTTTTTQVVTPPQTTIDDTPSFIQPSPVTTTPQTTTTTVLETTTTTVPEITTTVPETTTTVPETTTTVLATTTTTTTTTTVPETTTTQTTAVTETTENVGNSATTAPETTLPQNETEKIIEQIANLETEQITELIKNIEFDELDDKEIEKIVEVLNEASPEIKKEFEKEINVFDGKFDSYVAYGSKITVGERRVLIVVTALTMIIPAPVSRKT
jgi:hypothetical protein